MENTQTFFSSPRIDTELEGWDGATSLQTGGYSYFPPDPEDPFFNPWMLEAGLGVAGPDTVVTVGGCDSTFPIARTPPPALSPAFSYFDPTIFMDRPVDDFLPAASPASSNAATTNSIAWVAEMSPASSAAFSYAAATTNSMACVTEMSPASSPAFSSATTTNSTAWEAEMLLASSPALSYAATTNSTAWEARNISPASSPAFFNATTTNSTAEQAEDISLASSPAFYYAATTNSTAEQAENFSPASSPAFPYAATTNSTAEQAENFSPASSPAFPYAATTNSITMQTQTASPTSSSVWSYSPLSLEPPTPVTAPPSYRTPSPTPPPVHVLDGPVMGNGERSRRMPTSPHKRQISRVRKPRPQRRVRQEYMCDGCGQKFPNVGNLNRHLTTTGCAPKQLEFRCIVAGCERTYNRKDNRDAHSRKCRMR